MKSRARVEFGVGTFKLHVGKAQFFAIFSTRVRSNSPVARADRPKGLSLQVGEVAEWLKAALC